MLYEVITQVIATVQRIARERRMAVGVVEHVMGVIRELTQRVIVLEAGELIAERNNFV